MLRYYLAQSSGNIPLLKIQVALTVFSSKLSSGGNLEMKEFFLGIFAKKTQRKNITNCKKCHIDCYNRNSPELESYLTYISSTSQKSNSKKKNIFFERFHQKNEKSEFLGCLLFFLKKEKRLVFLKKVNANLIGEMWAYENLKKNTKMPRIRNRK